MITLGSGIVSGPKHHYHYIYIYNSPIVDILLFIKDRQTIRLDNSATSSDYDILVNDYRFFYQDN